MLESNYIVGHIKSLAAILICLLVSTAVLAQFKKGEKLFEKGRYTEAIKPLRKSFETDDNFDAGVLLAKSYYKLQDYQYAYDVISVIGRENLKTSDDKRFYADVLIANDDFSGAYVSLIELISENQSDSKSFLWLDKVDDLLAWDTLTTKSDIKNVKGINSFYNEYAPYFDKSGELWFVSDLTTVQTVFPNAYNNQSLHLYYKTKLKKSDGTEVKKPSWLMKRRDYYYHDGPIVKWPDQEKYVLTLRDIDAPVDGLIGLYFSEMTGTEEDIIPFKYNDKYNTGHATFMNDGKRMVFASDRPGGYGQMDLWYTNWEDGTWTPPVNMGPKINTPFNELFPTYFETRLYFSSDRRDKGYGGLDIYFASKLYDFNEVANLRAPINSPYDDFSLTFINAKSGYFTSNRRNGEGGDDIYAFTYSPEQIDIQKTRLQILNAELQLGTEVEIYDSYGDLVATTKISEGQIIKASNLKSREIYTLQIIGADLPEQALLGTLSSKGKLIATFQQVSPNKFKFELLPTEDYLLEKQENKDDSELQFSIDGKVVADESVNLEGIPVALISAGGVVLSKSKTLEDGQFSLEGAKINEDYTIATEGMEDYHEIDVYGETGAVTQSLRPIGENKFAYTRSAPAALWMSTASIKVPQVFAVVLNNEPVLGEEVVLYDGEDNELKKPVVDEDGFMDIGSLTGGNAYRLFMPERDLGFEDRLVILDGQGDTSQTVRPFDEKNFFFEYLLYRDYGSDLAGEPVSKNKVFKVRITDYGKPERSAFLLEDLDTGTSDTLFANGKGILIVRGIDSKNDFRLLSLNRDLSESSMIQVYSENNKLIYESKVFDKRYFNLVFLENEDFGLAQESNTDKSKLTVSFLGSFSIDESKNTEIELRDSSGALIDATIVSSANSFVFKDLDPDKEYYVHSLRELGFGSMKIINTKSQALMRIKPDESGIYILPKASSVFKINVADGPPKAQEFLIRDKETGRIDTVRTTPSGEFTVKPEFIEHDYELSAIEGTLPPNCKIQIFDHQNRLIYETESKDDRTFILKFLKQEDYSLAAQDNSDLSMLNFGLSGEFKTDVSVKSKVELFSIDGKMLAETYTGSDMSFVLNKIPSEQKFIIRADFSDSDAIVEVENTQTGKKQQFQREANGDFIIDFEDGSEQLTLKQGNKEVKVSEGSKFNLSEVYYDFNSYRLKNESKEYLNELVSLLKENPGVKIQVRSHTDSRGPSNYNKLLSQKRADAVIQFIESKGIGANRLESVGLGETELTNKCEDGVPCTNAEHAKNRRTEFAILRGES